MRPSPLSCSRSPTHKNSTLTRAYTHTHPATGGVVAPPTTVTVLPPCGGTIASARREGAAGDGTDLPLPAVVVMMAGAAVAVPNSPAADRTRAAAIGTRAAGAEGYVCVVWCCVCGEAPVEAARVVFVCCRVEELGRFVACRIR